MLKGLRKNTKIIIWTVIVSFALWGGYSVGTQFRKEGRIAGEVFGKEVTFQEFDRFFKASQIFSFGGEIPEDPDRISQYAWQNIIMSREASRLGIKVSDDEVRSEIFRLLGSEGIQEPSPELYRRWLQGALRETPQEFEKKIREFLRIQKLIRQVNEPAVKPVTEKEIRERFLEEHGKLALKLAVFPTFEDASAFAPTLQGLLAQGDSGLYQDVVRSTGLLDLRSLTVVSSLPRDMVFLLYQMEKGDVSGPFPLLNNFAVALVTDKENADDTQLVEALEEQYRTALLEEKRYSRFLLWNADLMNRADLKDYLPKPEEPAPESAPAT